MALATTILSLLLALAFVGSGALKLVGAKQSLQIRDQLHVGQRLWRLIGALEVAAGIGLAAGLAVPVLGLASAVGLSALMVGAIGAHGRANDLRNAGPALALLVLAVAVAVLRITTL
jgi:uncharacterized membrane protein YphA (DoxX/SURF4 family)